MKFHTLNLMVRSSPFVLETHQVFSLATIIDIATLKEHQTKLYDIYTTYATYTAIFMGYCRAPFSRATNFADFVDFLDFHKICFTENY